MSGRAVNSIIAVLVLISAHAFADDTKIRATISLPRVSAKVQFQIQTDAMDVPPETLLKRLNGTNDDIDVYLSVGRAFDAITGDPARSEAGKSAYRKAADLLKALLASNPKDAWALSRYGIALWYGEHSPEADKPLKQAVDQGQMDWRCVANLAEYIQSASLYTALDTEMHGVIRFEDPIGTEKRIKALLGSPKLAQTVETLKAKSMEADALMDKAVALSPTNPSVYARRFGFRLISHVCTENILRAAAGQSQDYATVLNQPALDDKWKCAELDPTNPVFTGSALVYELMVRLPSFAGEKFLDLSAAISRLPETSQPRVKAAFARLKEIGSSSDKRTAGKALTELANACILLTDYTGAAQAASEAFHIDPNNKAAAQALNAAYLSTGKFPELIKALREEIAAEDTPFRRLFLIKSLQVSGDTAGELLELKGAADKFSEDLLLQIAVCDELMRKGDTASLKQAGDVIAKCQSLFYKLPESERNENKANFEIARGIYLALIGKPDVALTALGHVLEYDPDNQDARFSYQAILEAAGLSSK